MKAKNQRHMFKSPFPKDAAQNVDIRVFTKRCISISKKEWLKMQLHFWDKKTDDYYHWEPNEGVMVPRWTYEEHQWSFPAVKKLTVNNIWERIDSFDVHSYDKAINWEFDEETGEGNHLYDIFNYESFHERAGTEKKEWSRCASPLETYFYIHRNFQPNDNFWKVDDVFTPYEFNGNFAICDYIQKNPEIWNERENRKKLHKVKWRELYPVGCDLSNWVKGEKYSNEFFSWSERYNLKVRQDIHT